MVEQDTATTDPHEPSDPEIPEPSVVRATTSAQEIEHAIFNLMVTLVHALGDAGAQRPQACEHVASLLERYAAALRSQSL